MPWCGNAACLVIALKFYDRENELNALGKACSSKNAEMIVVSGRRRIGKSRLVHEFLKGKPRAEYAEVLVVPKEEKQVAGDFAAALADEYAPAFKSVSEALEYFFVKSGKRILFVDEFPNLIEVNSSLPYEFLKAWENHKGRSPKKLVFSGSYVSMMDKIFTRQKAPLFSRASYYLTLQPLPVQVVWAIQEDLGVKNAVEKIRNYCVFGGVPYYYELFENRGRADMVNELFFDVAAPLKEEGLNVLRQEFGAAYKKYFSIIEAIGAGLVSAGEIANKLGVSQTTLSKYVASLQNDFKLVERMVPFGQNPARSKKGIYSIKDNAVAFWFSSVYGKTQPPSEKELNDFVSKRFELFCKEFLAAYLKNSGEAVVRTGRWWGQAETKPGVFEQREVDVVVETREKVYAGECKWTNEKTGWREFNRFKESADALKTVLKTRKKVECAFFSKNGFDFKEKTGFEPLLFDAEKIEREIKRFS